MTRWKFRSYRSNGVDEVKQWVEQQVSSVLTELFVITSYLRDRPGDDWECYDYRSLTGNLDLLAEIRIKLEQADIDKWIHYRILGFRNDAAMEFTMLLGVRKTKHFSYTAPGGVSLSRRLHVLQDRDKFSCDADWLGLL